MDFTGWMFENKDKKEDVKTSTSDIKSRVGEVPSFLTGGATPLSTYTPNVTYTPTPSTPQVDPRIIDMLTKVIPVPVRL